MSETTSPEGIVCGRNAVREALKSERVPDKIYVQRGVRHGSIGEIIALAKKVRVPVEETDRERLDRLSDGVVHQGIVALTAPISYVSIEEMIARANEKGETPLLVIADHLADPHNLGALIRCCEGAGVHGLILPKRDACPINQTVMKASAGAAQHLNIARVSSLAAACDKLKELGVWICAVEADGDDFASFDYDTPLAFVLGSEERGVSRLVREKSDFCLSLPMCGKVNSLNVSCAGAVVLYTARARRTK